MEAINFDELIAFIVLAIALMGSPGPATLSLAAVGAAYGFKASRRYMIGMIISTMIVITGVAVGIFATILTIPYAREVLSIIAVVYLVYLAVKIATAPPLGKPTDPTKNPKFMDGFFLSLANPKLYAAMTALFSGFQVIPTSHAQSSYLQIGLCYLLLWGLNPAWLLAGGTLRQLLHDEKTSRRVNFGFAVLLVASVVLVVFL